MAGVKLPITAPTTKVESTKDLFYTILQCRTHIICFRLYVCIVLHSLGWTSQVFPKDFWLQPHFLGSSFFLHHTPGTPTVWTLCLCYNSKVQNKDCPGSLVTGALQRLSMTSSIPSDTPQLQLHQCRGYARCVVSLICHLPLQPFYVTLGQWLCSVFPPTTPVLRDFSSWLLFCCSLVTFILLFLLIYNNSKVFLSL